MHHRVGLVFLGIVINRFAKHLLKHEKWPPNNVAKQVFRDERYNFIEYLTGASSTNDDV